MRVKLLATAIMGAGLLFSAPAVAQHTPEGSEIEIPQPPEGMGQIVFFRPGGMGMAMGCTVNEGEGKVSSLGNNRFFVLQTEPGTHEYWVRNEKTDALTLLVEPDETQFVRCRIKMGFLSGRPDMAPSDGATFAEASDNLKPVDDDDMEAQGVLRAADFVVTEDIVVAEES